MNSHPSSALSLGLLSAPPSSRRGKIARLPAAIRHQLNLRLMDNESSTVTLAWLNALPETQQILAAHFDSVPVSPQNLSEWRHGGLQEWLLRQDILAHAEGLAETAADLAQFQPAPSLADNLATIVAARLAALLNQWDGEVTPEFEAKLRVLQSLSRTVVGLQKSLHTAARDNVELQKDAETRRRDEAAAAARQANLPELVRNHVAQRRNAWSAAECRILAANAFSLPLTEVDRYLAPSNLIKPDQTSTPESLPA